MDGDQRKGERGGIFTIKGESGDSDGTLVCRRSYTHPSPRVFLVRPSALNHTRSSEGKEIVMQSLMLVPIMHVSPTRDLI